MEQPYDENIDYKVLHCNWVKEMKNFRPKGGNPLPAVYNSYIEFLEHMYFTTDGCFKQNFTAYLNLRDDFRYSLKNTTIRDEVAIMFGVKPVNDNPKYFVTWNWEDANFKLPKILKGVERLFAKGWIDNAKGVFEYHGSKDNHPHFHCVIQVNAHKTIGRFREKMLESALSGTLSGLNFCDIKFFNVHSDDYVEGDKTEKKMDNVLLDKEWRAKYNLKELYVK